MSDNQTQSPPTDTQTSFSPEPVVEQPAQNPEPQPVPIENPTTAPNPSDLPNPPYSPNPPENSQPTLPGPSAPVPETPPPQPTPEPTPQVIVPDLHYPFYGSVSPSLVFNQIPDDERIKQKFQEWGIVGHNGLDYPLTEGTEVLACDDGKVTLAGQNGDYGVCVVIQHSWGQSYYAHLQETKVSVGKEVNAADLIGLSDTSGAAFGPHLHFAIKPNNANESNDYLGFIDPVPYLKIEAQKPVVSQPILQSEPPKLPKEPKPIVQQPIQQPPAPELSVPSEPSNPPAPSVPVEPTINIEPVPMPTQEVPQQSQTAQTPQISDEEIQKQVDEKFDDELDARRLKANEARKENRQEHLAMIEKLLSEKKEITNQDVQNLVHVSRATAFYYLTSLINSGRIKVEGKGRATVYKNIFS